ncbi:hypothetical protein evm_007335 [Chilo suppressalis]|nr:hypothetical protein evm_007335 [Chilo suppressalis]
MAEKAPQKTKIEKIPDGLKFAFGGLAGMVSICVVQPMDLLKTRMQLSGGGRTTFSVASEIVRKEGVLGLYNGLSAAVLRQALYSTSRFGIYDNLFEYYKKLVL